MLHSYMSLVKETALSLPQLGVRFLADSNSWNVIGKPQNCEVDAQYYRVSWPLKIFVHSLAHVFSVGLC